MNSIGLQSRLALQIASVRKEIKAVHMQKKTMPVAVYHDQLEELHSTLAKLKQKQNMKDVLEVWCDSNPSDFECRVYE
jgi:flagellar biosynthesis/type III secretory pathway protein FliH